MYILSGTVLIGLDLLLAGALIVFRTLRLADVQFTPLEWYASVTCISALFVYLNYSVTRWAIRIGARALAEQRS